MFKRILIRFVNGFCYSVAITMLIQALVIHSTGELPLLPEYLMRFDNPLSAFISQLILIGIMSAVTSAGTAVFEAKRIGLLAQSILFLFIMLSAWIPVACIAWGFHKYTLSMIVTICSIVVSYSICWGIQYALCRKDIEAINAMLSEEKEGR
ncbi:MAG: DUF3021 family protein [Oscillospiraceae bacterium]|nr:DUF3021 family protein [Oscillospiraceae bacterium]